MSFIQLILEALSPELRKLFVPFILSLSKAASKTDNSFDDVVVGLLISLFAIKDKKADKK